MAKEDEEKTTPPGISSTLVAGLDIVTAHLWLVLIPILLDVFYWIGPQLRASQLVLHVADLFQRVGALPEMSTRLAEIAGRTNLFTVISVPYLGVPGLMAGLVMPESTPVQPLTMEVASSVAWLQWFFALTLLGLLIATLYYGLIARAVCIQDMERCPLFQNRSASATGRSLPGRAQAIWPQFLRRLPILWLRVIGLVIAIVLILLAIYVPLLLFASVAALLTPGLASLVILLGMGFIVWLLFYLSFSLHGILLADRAVLRALYGSVRLVRNHWLPALLLFLLVVGIRNLLSWIWLTVDTGSWLTLISIVGYGFINSSLVAATFIFFRDRSGFDSRRLSVVGD